LHNSLFRDFQHSALIPDLKPDTLYYFTLQSRDVFGVSQTTDLYSFRTRKAAVPQIAAPGSPEKVLVLGFSTVAPTPAKALYRVKGQSDVYALIGGQRYRMTGPKSLSRYSSKLAVKEITQIKLETYPLVHLVKAADGNTVYYLYRRSNNRILKLALPSPAVFASYPANRWNDIISVDTPELAQYPDAVLIHAQGDATIYLLTNSIKHPIVSDIAFRAHGYTYSDVVDISINHLNSYQTGSSVQ
jgi:hypothetical protein